MFRGVVAVHLKPQAFRFVHPPRTSSAIPTVFGQHLDHYLVVTPPGEVIFHSPEDIDAPSDLGEPAMRPVREQLRDALAAAVAGQSQVVAVRNVATPVFDMEQGHNYWVAAVPIRGGRMVLLSTFPEADVMQAINRSLIRRAICCSAACASCWRSCCLPPDAFRVRWRIWRSPPASWVRAIWMWRFPSRAAR